MKPVDKMSFRFYLLIPIILASILACTPSKEEAAAIVNGEIITKNNLQLSMGNMLNRYKDMKIEIDSTKVDTLRGKILDSMVGGELLLQESGKSEITVSKEEVSTEMESMKNQYPSEEMYEESMASQGLTEEMISDQIWRNLMIRKYVDEVITAAIVITDEEKIEYYEKNIGRYTHGDQVAARHIILSATETDPPESLETKKQLLLSLRDRVKAGEDFSKLATEYSEGPTSSKGGDLGYFSHGQMVKPFEEAAFAMEPGEMSEIVQSEFGLHLIQVYDTREAGEQSFEEVEESIEAILKRPKINMEIEKLIEELKSKAIIEILI